MKQKVLIFLLAASSVAAAAQTAAKPAAPAATATHKAGTAATSAVKLPPGVPAARGVLHTAFSLKYQDIKIGTGADAEPNKMYKVQYTGWRAADGVKFDSSFDRPGPPVLDKDGKPEKDADGKPVLGPSQPMAFPQGMGRLIPGFDQGFTGMKVGGKRRLFIPWQLAYGTRDMPGRGAEHPGIPPKSDLIFDVELVDVADLPTPPTRPGMGGPGGRPLPPRPIVPTTPGKPAAPGTAAPAPGSAAPSTTTPAPTIAPTTTAPSTTQPPATTPVPSTPPSH